METEQLRVALVVGTLGQGGAEKQALYIARALKEANVNVKVFSLTKDEYFEPMFKAIGLHPIWVGRFSNPFLRIVKIILELTQFRPHIIHSTHTYMNLYAGIAGKYLRTLSIGSVRADINHVRDAYGFFTSLLLRLPSVIISNSQNAAESLINDKFIKQESSYCLTNVIDLNEFDEQLETNCQDNVSKQYNAVLVARLVKVKQVENFLRAIAIARAYVPKLTGAVVGDGPELLRLKALAESLGLFPDGVRFLGRRDDIPTILSQSEILILSSRYEGFPNVIIEAMAASLPVITTPVGDANRIVIHSQTGYVAPFENVDVMARYIIKLTQSADLRHQLGKAGRERVENYYSYKSLQKQLMRLYSDIAHQHNNQTIGSLII